MVEIKPGYLFEKKHITYENQKYEIFKLVDYIMGICFTNVTQNEMCNILTGKYGGEYSCFLDKDKNEENLIFIPENIEEDIKKNDSIVNFTKIRQNRLDKENKYYIRNKKDNLAALLNDELVDYIEKEEEKNNKDISSMYETVRETIVSEDEQIKQILATLYKNVTVVDSNLDKELIAKLKENILICGPTGTGKTELLKIISRNLNVPMVIINGSTFSDNNYDTKIADALKNLLFDANNKNTLAEKGILVIDDLEEIAENYTSSIPSRSKKALQKSLTNLLEGKKIYIDNTYFDTSKLTVIATINSPEITNSDDYSKLTPKGFIKYGFDEELIEKFSKIIAMKPLTKEDIIKILKESDFSPLNTSKEFFKLLGINFDFNDDFIEYIANKAMEKGNGAKSLKTIFDNCISDALFDIFNDDYQNISLVRPNEENEKPYILSKKNEKLNILYKGMEKRGFFGKRK